MAAVSVLRAFSALVSIFAVVDLICVLTVVLRFVTYSEPLYILCMTGADQAQQQAQEMLKRRQRRILQLVKDFRNNNTVNLANILSSQV